MRWRGATFLDAMAVLAVLAAILISLVLLAPLVERPRIHSSVASCGSNIRQFIYAALTYANDWNEWLPTRSAGQDPWLFAASRLPIIGFDTTTSWSPQSQRSPVGSAASPGSGRPPGVGGLAHVLRDYLKTDRDLAYCPGGWVQLDNAIVMDCFYPIAIGYNWLPYRSDQSGQCVGRLCTADKPEDVARLASDRPDLLLATDFSWRLPNRGDRLAMNHHKPGLMPPELTPAGRPAGDVADWPAYSTPEFPCGPPAGNIGRLDARVVWRQGDEVSESRYVVEGTILMW